MLLQQARPGEYVRPFDTLENFYHGVAATCAHLRQEQYFISSAIRFKNAVPVIDLQQAWMALRHKHPKIAAVPNVTGTRLVYTVPSTDILDEWLETTFVVHSDGEDQSADRLHSILPPSRLFTVHYIPSSQELLFRASHWRIDGIGMVMLQHSFLELLSQGPQPLVFDGSEVSRFPPSLDEAAGFSLNITEDMKRSTEAELSVLSSGAPLASLSESLQNNTPGNSRRASIRFPNELSRQIIEACKGRGLTVTVAAQAAIMRAAERHMAPEDGRTVTLNVYNIRDGLPAPWRDQQGAAGLYHTGRLCSVDMDVNRDFNATARSLRSHYEQSLQPLFGHMTHYVQTMTALLSAPLELANQAPGAARPELSSLGVIDNRLQTTYTGPGGTVDVEDWWLGVEATNRLLSMFLWTRAGELHLGCHYNEAFYEQEFVERFLEECKSVLVDEMIPQ
ncbi:hypothetical protein FQN54_007032 [Arachnomyces sp. PD_36]|nr:hypothetical protein FQN54_007032 [Arachnomyces sp. PD_36]